MKENLAKWQNALDGKAWNSLFFCNHDQPRIVSRLGDGSPESAKCIATVLHFMQGTPYVYQGEELGMTNCPFGGIENYRDIESINAFRELTETGRRDPEELLRCIAYKSRDNARTPMQWTDGENAGFTTGTPWIMVNPNYRTINASAELADPDSVFHFYKKTISLRRNSPWSDVIVYGSFSLLSPEDEAVFAYTRELDGRMLLIVCNLAPDHTAYRLPEQVSGRQGQNLIGTLPLTDTMELSPWQAEVWELK